MMPAYRIVIPARYASQRLPGKPLRLIHDLPMIEWVYRAALETEAAEVVVATDDQRIVDAVESFGGQAYMTSSEHRSGTDRVVEVARRLRWQADDIVVNLQGDEPLMPAANISQVADILSQRQCDMATLHKPISAAEAEDPDLVKLVLDQSGRALYFSRARIPHERGDTRPDYFGHIGIYSYRVGFIEQFASLAPCQLELSESLEQLRALYNGYSLHSAIARQTPGPGIDTEQDLVRVTQMMAAHKP